MLTARFILGAMICASPIVLLWDGLMVQGLIAGLVAVALSVVVRTLRPGDMDFLVSVSLPAIVILAVPALWILVQILPLRLFAHPIWTSSKMALGRPVAASISLDPGESVVALGQYLSIVALGFVSTAVAIDRKRAGGLAFAVTMGSAAVALILLARECAFLGAMLSPRVQMAAVDCASMGLIISSGFCIRAFQHYQVRHTSWAHALRSLLSAYALPSLSVVICAAAVALYGNHGVQLATGFGISALAIILIVRRVAPRTIAAVIPVPLAVGLAVAFFIPLKAAHEQISLSGFSTSPTSIAKAMVDDSPLVGTGAGTFAALAAIYRGPDDLAADDLATSAAAAIAVELGTPMLCLIGLAAILEVVMLMRASLRRRRDSLYSAMGGSILLTLVLLGVVNVGLLSIAPELIAAATLGMAFGQSKSRSLRL